MKFRIKSLTWLTRQVTLRFLLVPDHSTGAVSECVRLNAVVIFFLVDVAQQKLSANNIFTIAKRTVEGQASVKIHLGRVIWKPVIKANSGLKPTEVLILSLFVQQRVSLLMFVLFEIIQIQNWSNNINRKPRRKVTKLHWIISLILC